MNLEKTVMKRSFYLIVVLTLLTMIWTTGCTQKTSQEVQDTIDSMEVDTMPADTLESLIEETPMPKAADELFDDFIFNFAANRRLQLERTVFPLDVVSFGKASQMTRKQWKMERFFMRQGFYTIIAANMKDINAAKDTSIDHVVIEKIYLSDDYVQQYVFNRVEGLWMLQQIKTQAVHENSNGEFYSFYGKFVNDSLFQQQSLAETVDFSGPDPEDDFARMDGSIMPEQWSMFAPELPKGMIYNIVYGDRPLKGDKRVLVIRGIANGLETELTFKKSGGGYKLIKLTT